MIILFVLKNFQTRTVSDLYITITISENQWWWAFSAFVFESLSFLYFKRTAFPGIVFLIGRIFSFSVLNISSHSLLAWKISAEKSIDSLKGVQWLPNQTPQVATWLGPIYLSDLISFPLPLIYHPPASLDYCLFETFQVVLPWAIVNVVPSASIIMSPFLHIVDSYSSGWRPNFTSSEIPPLTTSPQKVYHPPHGISTVSLLILPLFS